MSKRIRVNNLPLYSTDDEIKTLFEKYGTVDMASIVIDRNTGRSRGFGFVDMSSGWDEAISALNQTDFCGRNIKVEEGKQRDSNRTSGLGPSGPRPGAYRK